MDGKYEPKHLRQVKLSHEAQVERYVPALVSGCRLFRFHFGSSYSRLTPAVESDQLAPRPSTQLWTMAPQLTTNEQTFIDDVVRKRGGTPMDALHAVHQARDHESAEFSNKTTIRLCTNGETRLRGRKEKRCRSQLLTKKDHRTLMQTRESLVQEATHALAMCRASQRGPTFGGAQTPTQQTPTEWSIHLGARPPLCRTCQGQRPLRDTLWCRSHCESFCPCVFSKEIAL